jgi:hypothetical protein
MEQKNQTQEVLTELKSQLHKYQKKREDLRYERKKNSFTIENCQKLEYSFEITALRLKQEVIDNQIWMYDDFIQTLTEAIENLQGTKL